MAGGPAQISYKLLFFCHPLDCIEAHPKHTLDYENVLEHAHKSNLKVRRQWGVGSVRIPLVPTTRELVVAPT